MVQTIFADLAVGQLSAVRMAMKAIYDCETASRNQMAFNDSSIHVLQLSLIPIDSVLYSAGPTDSLELTVEKADIITTIINLSGQSNLSASIYEACKSGNINDAMDLNDAVDARETIETNEKTMNEIILIAERDGNDSLTNGQIETLHSIADQCPYEGGRAVLTARAKLLALYDSTAYDDDQICERARLSSYKEDAVKILRVVPNPSKDFTTITLSAPVKEIAIFFIYNSYGQLVSKNELPSDFNEVKLNLTSLKVGVYHFTLNTCKRQIGVGKLTVIR